MAATFKGRAKKGGTIENLRDKGENRLWIEEMKSKIVKQRGIETKKAGTKIRIIQSNLHALTSVMYRFVLQPCLNLPKSKFPQDQRRVNDPGKCVRNYSLLKFRLCSGVYIDFALCRLSMTRIDR